MQSRLTLSADRLGIVASAACVVHCVVTPLLVSFSVVLAHLLPGEEKTHRSLALAVAVLGALALLRGYRSHRQGSVLVLMAAGLSFIFTGAWFGDRLPSHTVEVLVTLLGSTLMIVAHRRNHTFCQSCRTCVP